MSDAARTTSGESRAKSAATTTTATEPATAPSVKHQQQQQLHNQTYSLHLQQQQQKQPQPQPQPQRQPLPEKSSIAAIGDAGSCIALAPRPAPAEAPLGRQCLSRLLTAVFSTPGLVLLVVAYSVMGALLFPLLEAPQDLSKSVAIAKSREDCLRELWIITEKLNVLYERNWTMLVHEQLRRFEGSIVAATRHGGGLGGGTAIAGRFGGPLDALSEARWTFSEALLYSVTVITTIGHGSLTPKTAAGKVATILYALVGVPLMLMCLSSLGALLAEALQCTYARLCCRLARRRRGSGGQRPKHGRRCESVGDGCPGPRGGPAEEADHGPHHEMDCKGCKYDAIIGETNLNNGYEYAVNGAPTTGAEDDCQLLPTTTTTTTSVDHGSPGIQGTRAQFYQRSAPYVQQQHQQHQAHQPAGAATEVVLMSSCATSSAPPQHLQHPLQQGYHIVPATTPSPTHANLRQHQQQPQQHFVAVPSNVVRFQATAAGGAPPNGSVLNYCQSAGVAVSGAATIFFPVAASGSATATTSSGPPLAAPSSCAQLLFNQPLVKYHTIQLQHRHAPFAGPVAGHLTLPPPPAYQTATVHGVRRAKFLTKPLPQEINTLLAESDVSCRQDVQQTGGATTETTTTMTSAPATTTSGSPASTTSSSTTTSPPAAHTTASARSGGGSGGGGASCATVDIMEDEEENDQSRLGSCSHGTPSRVPLIPSANHCRAQDDGATSSRGGARGLIHSTAASFHRHTLHTFHRGGSRKAGCSLHTGAGRTAGSSNGCYGDTTETSDDDDELGRGSEDFVLSGDGGGDGDDNSDEEDLEDETAAELGGDREGAQVPIAIVLLILVCYICLGTVIFAFWEDWSLIDGAYFCFVTLSTIGYGDFLPERTFRGPEVQLFACCAYLLLGLVLVAMSFSILETQLMWKCKRIAVRLKLASD